MTQRCIEVASGRLVTDEDFRQTFVRDPRTALAELLESGTHLTHAEIAALVARGCGGASRNRSIRDQMRVARPFQGRVSRVKARATSISKTR